MISNNVLNKAEMIAEEFKSAKPFPHVCIDDFFENKYAEILLHDFPVFNPENAMNEFGQIGGKAAIAKIADISEFYRNVHEYITSQEFTFTMSRLTGIPDLIADPRMFGGGTRDNYHGQELDPHVDFNYDQDVALHRRINIILYLNKEWQEEWGGAIQLHSNPRRPENDEVVSFCCIFNRAVIFETSERSWHGFPRIELPENKRSLSRKSLSVYLYTKERPPELTVPPHSTFYVQRPMSSALGVGHTLTEYDVAELQKGVRNRDSWIEFYQNLEGKLSGYIGNLKNDLERARGMLRIPVVGSVSQHGSCHGFFPDGWIGPDMNVVIEARAELSKMIVRGFRWERFAQTQKLTVSIDEEITTVLLMEPGDFELEFAIKRHDMKLNIEFKVSPTFSPAVEGVGDDGRNLGLLIREIEFISYVKSESSEPQDVKDAVDKIYRGILKRSSSLAELADAKLRLTDGEGRGDLAFALTKSEETERYRTALYATPGHFYSPIVDPATVRERFPRERRMNHERLADVDLDLEKMTGFWQTTMSPIARMTPFPDEPTPGFRFHFENPAYSYGDAITLRAMILHFRPKRLIEVGSGWSSACALDTLDSDSSLTTEVTFVEPYPELLLSIIKKGDLQKVRIIPKGIQEVPLHEFEKLGEGDILFIDSTHVLKTGSDVAFELCEILPRLRSGVIVHFHDIFYPFEYGYEWVIEQNRSWNEIYALRNFLAFNSSFEVLFFNDFFAAFQKEILMMDCPKFLLNPGGSIWIRRTK